MAGCGDPAILVVVLGSAAQFARQSIHEHIAGTGVERSRNVRSARTGADDRDVRDAANVENDDRFFAGQMPKKPQVSERDKGRPLAARSKIAAAEVIDDGKTGSFGQKLGIENLERAANGYSVPVAGVGNVSQGLAVRGESIDAAFRMSAATTSWSAHLPTRTSSCG